MIQPQSVNTEIDLESFVPCLNNLHCYIFFAQGLINIMRPRNPVCDDFDEALWPSKRLSFQATPCREFHLDLCAFCFDLPQCFSLDSEKKLVNPVALHLIAFLLPPSGVHGQVWPSSRFRWGEQPNMLLPPLRVLRPTRSCLRQSVWFMTGPAPGVRK